VLAALAHGTAAPTRAVAIAPSSVVWQALPEKGRPPRTAAWSQGREPLPWLAIHGDRILPEMIEHSLLDRLSGHPRPHALHMRPAYAPSLRKGDDVERTAIPVERIECPLLLLSGADDQMWPAAQMTEMIAERRNRAGVGSDDMSLVFPRAGHFLRPPITPTTVPWNDTLVSGGCAEGNARAQADGWRAILTFLG
jgi:pimeloyl-ACP methyl ester carboxylesterase